MQTLNQKYAVKGRYQLTFRNAQGEITRQISYEKMHNLIVDGGLNALISAVTVDYIAVGDDNTAVSANDTTLGNETARKAVQDNTVSGNHKYFSTFFGLTEAVGTIREIGSFQGGSTSPDTGTLISHIAEENTELPVTKANTESLTIDFDLEVVNVT